MIFNETIVKMKSCQVLGQVVKKSWQHIGEWVTKLVMVNHGVMLVFSHQVHFFTMKILKFNLIEEAKYCKDIWLLFFDPFICLILANI